MSVCFSPRRYALLLSVVSFSSAGLGFDAARAGTPLDKNPLDKEGAVIPDEVFEMPSLPATRNPKNRFGVQGGVTFGVRAEFVSDAFVGTNITAKKAKGPEDVVVDRGRASADDNGGVTGEIFYERTLGESDLFTEGVDETWGLHVGVGFSQIDLRDSSTLNSFRPLDPNDPPGTAPEFLEQGTMVHDLEADLWYLNVGLYKESYLTDQFYAKMGGGLSVAYIEGKYSLTGPFDFAPESAEEEDILVGGYLDLTLGYDINRHWGLYAGVRYQYLTSFEMDTRYSDAELKFDQAFMAYIGLRFTF